VLGSSDSVPESDEAVVDSSSDCSLLFDFPDLDRERFSVSPRFRRRHRRELWLSVVSAFVRRQNHCLRVSTCDSSFFLAGKRYRPVPYRCRAVSSVCSSYDHRRPRQIGVFACFWNGVRIRTLHRPQQPWDPRERRRTRESSGKTQQR
jgi:hypothetical protein